MKHRNSGVKLNRSPSHRKALFMNLANALITYGKIRTTEVKAKALRTVIEPLITLGLRNDLHARRLAYKKLGDHKQVQRLFDVVAPVFAGVPGGYTRVTRLALPRKGDCASMAIIEFTKFPTAEFVEAATAAVKKPVAKKPAAKKPAVAKETAPKKPAVKKPVAKKPAI